MSADYGGVKAIGQIEMFDDSHSFTLPWHHHHHSQGD